MAHLFDRARLTIVTALAAIGCIALSSNAQVLLDEPPEPARGAVVEEKLGARIPETIKLQNADRRWVEIGEYFDQKASDGRPKPTILAMVYYDCPVVCEVTLTKLNEALQGLDFTVGEDFNLVVVSFDHTEQVRAAFERRELSVLGYNRPITDEVRAGFAYHVTDEQNALNLSRATGFNYRRLANGEYSHPVALMMLTPEGTISRYIYGFDYPPRRLKLALLEASQGDIAESWGDRLLFTCYVWDPNAAAYSMEAWFIMRAAGVLTMLALGGLIGGMLLRSRNQGRNKAKLAAKTHDDTDNGSHTERALA
ncbi:MAG: hypothetical protein AAGB51_07210 [Planctomycetota bacterium]